MNCFRKKENKIVPIDCNLEIDDFIVNENELYCSGCHESSDDLDKFIICGGCDKYFCCKIAGECIGKNCFIQEDNKIYRVHYCYSCISNFYGGKKCLCKECKIK